MFSGLNGPSCTRPRTFSVCVDWSQPEGDSFTLFSSFVASSGLEFEGSVDEIAKLQEMFNFLIENHSLPSSSSTKMALL